MGLGPDSTHLPIAAVPRLAVVWGLIEAPLGTLAGAWLYKDDVRG